MKNADGVGSRNGTASVPGIGICSAATTSFSQASDAIGTAAQPGTQLSGPVEIGFGIWTGRVVSGATIYFLNAWDLKTASATIRKIVVVVTAT